MVGLLVAAAALRWWRLDRLPPGLQFDEAYNALDAIAVLHGRWAVFFPANGGREPLLTYLQAPLLAALGEDWAMLALRFACALVGLLTIATTYRTLASLWDSRWLGSLAAAYLAFSYWHLHFSRYGIRAILAPLWASLAVGLWWRLTTARPEGRATRHRIPATERSAEVLLGAILAAWLYSHPTGRLFPLVLVADTVSRSLRRRVSARRAWAVLATAGASAACLVAPLALYFARQPAQFVGHPADVSLLAVAQREHGGQPLLALVAQLAAVAGMFLLRGDPSLLHNRSGLPVFDPLTGMLFVVGIGVWLAASSAKGRSQGDSQRAVTPRQQDAAILVGLWLFIMLLPTVFSDRPPNYSRAIAALPAIVSLPALGLLFACRQCRLSRPFRPFRPRPCIALAGGCLGVALVWTAAQYFVAFGQHTPGVARSYDVPIMSAYQALAAMAADRAVFVMPVWGEHATFAYLNRHGPVQSLDASDAWLLPAGAHGTVNAFPRREKDVDDWLKEAGRVYGHAGRRLEIPDPTGGPLLVAYEVSAAAAGDMKPPRDAPLEPEHWAGVEFGGRIELVGYRYGATAPGELLPILFVWRARRPVAGDWTLFVHLQDADGRPLGQSDERPANGSYPTNRWREGDILIDRAIPRLSADARGQVHIAIGWYDARSGARLPVAGGTEYLLTPLTLPTDPPARAQRDRTSRPAAAFAMPAREPAP